MIKRTNKITALLIAATSIMSLVPAMAADSTRLATKEGTIQEVVAFKDGKYVYEGYKTDGDNKSVYYNDGQKDTEINNLTDATLQDKYNNDSVIAFDGSDEYLVNLSDGKVTDQDVASDLQNTSENKLVAKLKKTSRYGSNVSVDLQKITPNQFGDVWYSYISNAANVTNGRQAVIQVTPDVFNGSTDIMVAGHIFKASGDTVTGDFTSGSKADFAIKAITKSYTGFAADIKSTDAGTIQLTQTTTPAAVNLAAIQALSENVTITADNNDGTTATKLAVAIKDATKVAKIFVDNTNFATVTPKNDAAAQFATAAQFAATVKSNSIPGYTTTVDATTGVLTLTATTAADYNQATLTADLSTNFANVKATVADTKVITSGYAGTISATGNTYRGYTNNTGAYIDADKTANIRVYNGTKMVALDKFNEDANDDGIAATVANSTTIAQDADYIYRVIDVTFTAGTVYDSKGGAKITTAKYLQKISKAQGDTEKDAYLPKSVESYEITTAVSDDTATAANKLVKYATGTDSSIVGLRVIGGAIYYTEMDDTDTIKTYVLKLQKNEKVEAAGSSSKVDTYVVKKDGDVDHDLKGDAGKAGASIDVDGNLWIVNEGKIYKSEKAGDFTEMFTCDRTIDSLEVYNADSLIAWAEGKDVYATMGKTTTETPVTTPVTTTGWVNTAAGWTFFKADGTQVKGQWVNDGGVWYMIKADGIMATGWYNDNGTWYFLNASGAMKTGWVLDGSTWYFLQSSGAMKTGWLNDNGTWYYLNTSGSMAANTTVDGYKLNASGAWVK
ncbi:hypothetical protein psyc5s11_50580 [Clostridium gelidum]|uniref:Uncharacterized protein n=1 Tax=Clostridium gelidum TaxID=704125 RepID=A0ABM7TAJ7_9CLOT|nr:hypothetical protein [Clostridium gelidum]BCZ48991.1 hypothetical protein psyc5s11_50580 [Clostridium gelidum]